MKTDTDEIIAAIEQKLDDALWVDDCDSRFSQLSLPGLQRTAAEFQSTSNHEVESVVPTRVMGHPVIPTIHRLEAFDANVSHHASLRKPLPSGPLKWSVDSSRTAEHAFTCARPSAVVVSASSMIRALNLEACVFPDWQQEESASPLGVRSFCHQLHTSSAHAMLGTSTSRRVDPGRSSASEDRIDANE